MPNRTQVSYRENSKMTEHLSIFGASLANAAALILAWVLATAGIPPMAFYALFSLMISDVLFGVFKARRASIDVTSKRFLSGLYGKAAALVVVIQMGFALSATVEAFGYSDTVNTKHLLGTFFIVIMIGEVYSLFRNYMSAFHRTELPEWSAWAMLARSMVSLAENLISTITNRK